MVYRVLAVLGPGEEGVLVSLVLWTARWGLLVVVAWRGSGLIILTTTRPSTSERATIL